MLPPTARGVTVADEPAEGVTLRRWFGIGVPAVSTKVTETLTVEVPSAGTVPLAGDSVTADAVELGGGREGDRCSLDDDQIGIGGVGSREGE